MMPYESKFEETQVLKSLRLPEFVLKDLETAKVSIKLAVMKYADFLRRNDIVIVCGNPKCKNFLTAPQLNYKYTTIEKLGFNHDKELDFYFCSECKDKSKELTKAFRGIKMNLKRDELTEEQK